MNWKKCGRKRLWPNSDIQAWRCSWRPVKISIRIVCVRTDIWIQDLPNINQTCKVWSFRGGKSWQNLLVGVGGENISETSVLGVKGPSNVGNIEPAETPVSPRSFHESRGYCTLNLDISLIPTTEIKEQPIISRSKPRWNIRHNKNYMRNKITQ
jgi:hypothetical protein